jgi:DNA-directed RNA polymerase specialized sigma24 family protein
MTAAQRGDSAAYEKLLAELLPYLRRFVGRRLINAEAGEDVVARSDRSDPGSTASPAMP